MMERIVRALFTAQALGWILMLSALQILTLGISASLRNLDAGQSAYFFWVCFFAALMALGLGKRKLGGIQAAAVLAALGILGVWILGARLTSPLLELARAFIQLFPQVVTAVRFDVPIDSTRLNDAWTAVTGASGALAMRLRLWLMSMGESVTVSDDLVRNMIWMLLLWLVAAWMGWFTARRNALAALLPAILLLAAVTSYSGRRVESLWLLVFLLLLLMGIWNYRNHIAGWERKKVDYSESIRFDVAQAVVFLTMAVSVLAFVTPSISWREIRDALQKGGQNEVADLLGVQQEPYNPQPAPGPTPTLPREHLLQGGFAQSEEIVMTIRTGELPPVPERVLNVKAPRHYWRSSIYDRYAGDGWLTSGVRSQHYAPHTPVIPGLLNDYRTLHLDVEMAQPEGRLFWSGILFSVDVPFRADWRVPPQSSLFADQSALLQADMFAASSDTRSYRAQSYIPLVTEEQLRLVSTAYPEEISERYLRLPATVPERVYRLAEEITRNQPTAYDRAKAIEAHLRTYPYNLDIPAPPPGVDVADYFLFDLQQGYCDYYATAMVVLARASGLPARFVSGYAPGSYDSANAQYVVRELNAHSWAEVYFPAIGWIEFEPTAAQPGIERAVPEGALPAGQQPDPAAAALLQRFRLERAIYWFAPFGILIFLCLTYFTIIERLYYRRLAPPDAIEKIYRRIYRLGRPLAGPRTRAETTHEFVQKLATNLDWLGKNTRSEKMFFRAKQEIESLTNLYETVLFRRSSLEQKDSRQALMTWKQLRLRLLRARMAVFLRRVLRGTVKNYSRASAPVEDHSISAT